MVCVSAVVFGAALTLRAQTPAGPTAKTVWDGIYSEAQAKTGGELYMENCADCHGEFLAGLESAPPLVGSSFLSNWNKTPVRRLFDVVEQMPPDNPKSLTAKQYLDIVAYLLHANEFPTGKAALENDRSLLGQILITSTAPGQ